MLDAAGRRRDAEIAEVAHALAAARCAARLAGLGTGEFVVRELLLGAIDEINRAERAVARLVSTSSRDVST
jgi:HAMP domain-containing protein